MAQLSGLQVARLAIQVGVPSSQLVTCVAIAWAESGLRTDATGYNPGPRPGTVASRDRGLWQINDYYHSDVSNACAYDAFCNAQAMYRISSGGTNWYPWSTYNNGDYRQFIPAAQLAVHLAGETTGGPSIPTAPAPANAQQAYLRAATDSIQQRGNDPISASAYVLQKLFEDTAHGLFGPDR